MNYNHLHPDLRREWWISVFWYRKDFVEALGLNFCPAALSWGLCCGHTLGKASQKPNGLWLGEQWGQVEGGTGGGCYGCFSSLSNCCIHICLLAGVFSADKTKVCGKHLLILSEGGDRSWGTWELIFSFMTFTESQYLLWIKPYWQLCAKGQ